MVANVVAGYVWMTLGFMFIFIFGGKLLFQLLCIMLGCWFIFKGLRIFSLDRAMYKYSQKYFNDQFKR